MIVGKHKNVQYQDFRPIGSKGTPTCMRCGVSGIRNLKNTNCF